MKNSTEVTQFILLGLTDVPELQVPLFIMFSLIYLITLIGNSGMIVLRGRGALAGWSEHRGRTASFSTRGADRETGGRKGSCDG